jgi:hypothetical protein
MAELTLAALRAEGDAFMEALSREQYLALSGHKPNAELRPIYDRFARVLGPAALDLVRDAFRTSKEGSDDWRSARALLDWQVETHASRELAELDERIIAWEATSVIRLSGGREVPYQRAAVDMATEPRREERLALDDARAALVSSELAPMRAERLQRERDLIESLDVAPDYVASFEALSGIDLRALAAECERFLRETDAMWADVHGDAVRKHLGIAPGEATRADALALMRATRFDPYFDRESGLARSARRFVFRARCISCCSHTAAPRITVRCCTSWDTRCTSATCAMTCRSSFAGLATTRSRKGTRCSSTTSFTRQRGCYATVR